MEDERTPPTRRLNQIDFEHVSVQALTLSPVSPDRPAHRSLATLDHCCRNVGFVPDQVRSIDIDLENIASPLRLDGTMREADVIGTLLERTGPGLLLAIGTWPEGSAPPEAAAALRG